MWQDDAVEHDRQPPELTVLRWSAACRQGMLGHGAQRWPIQVRHRAIVQIGSRGPDPVQDRGPIPRRSAPAIATMAADLGWACLPDGQCRSRVDQQTCRWAFSLPLIWACDSSRPDHDSSAKVVPCPRNHRQLAARCPRIGLFAFGRRRFAAHGQDRRQVAAELRPEAVVGRRQHGPVDHRPQELGRLGLHVLGIRAVFFRL